MTDDGALFPDPGFRSPEQLGESARRTSRALAMLEARYHPLMGTPLHPDAPHVDDRLAPGPRCGNCTHSHWKAGASHTWLKCGERVTAGAATDLRAWWPGCAGWKE